MHASSGESKGEKGRGKRELGKAYLPGQGEERKRKGWNPFDQKIGQL